MRVEKLMPEVDKVDRVKEKLIVALDFDRLEEAEKIVTGLHDLVGMFKVGMQLYYSEGIRVLDAIHNRGGKVFLDLKLLDIPNTVAQAARVLTRYGVAMIDVHASGGKEMMARAVEAVHDEAYKLGIEPPLVVGVTVLTSITESVLKNEIGIIETLEQTVIRWTKLGIEAGLDGIVASAIEARAIKRECDCKIIVTPGIRPLWSVENDQKRVLTPREALRAGATHLVVGRPITRAKSPREAALRILEELV